MKDKALVRVYIRGLLALVAIASIPALLIMKVDIPQGLWVIITVVIGFYFGQDSVNGSSE